jgi:arylsulfatase A-like enzyme
MSMKLITILIFCAVLVGVGLSYMPRAGETEELSQNIPEVDIEPSQALADSAKHPNIVFILTDDLSLDLLQYMPHVLEMQKEGVTFNNYFVTDSLCCPSRSSIFTGRFPHDTGVFRNAGNDGGYRVFRDRGNERVTFAVSLSAAGYRTAMLGKYLNGYVPAIDPASPGWSHWTVAGFGYPEFNYNLNEDGTLVHYGKKSEDYLTDVLSRLAKRFINDSADTPFFIEVATFAPHAPYTPAPRDAGAFPGLKAPRTPSFNAEPDEDAPNWLRDKPPLSDADINTIDRDYRKRAQSVLAIDKMIGEIEEAVNKIGQENNTYFIFSSDNGYHMGEHRLMPGKMTAFDTDIHVPLIVTGPDVPAGQTVDELVENIDLCPTITELAGAKTPADVDGRSLVQLLQGKDVDDWRTAVLIEHHKPLSDSMGDPDAAPNNSGNPPTYEAIRTPTSVYVEYETDEKEFHDLGSDPDELYNTYTSLSEDEKNRLHAQLLDIKKCHNADSCWAAETSGHDSARN